MNAPINPPRPLVIDMDDTLLRTDTLLEALLTLARDRPWCLPLVPFWLLRGRANLKHQLGRHTRLAVDTLPANDALLDWLRRERDTGRDLHLYSAADQSVVDDVASHFAIFATARGSDGNVNLSGARKLAAIRAHLGPRFTYAGDSRKDVPIWRDCGSAILVGDTAGLAATLGPDIEIVQRFPSPRPDTAIWRRALRLHQWSKNALLFVAALLGGNLIGDLPRVLIGFVVFGCMASATYLINDMLDLPHDRFHRSKRHRPLASGALGLRQAGLAVLLLGGAAAGLLAFMPAAFGLVTLLYLVVTLAYSALIKRMLMLDVFTLAGLFTIRIDAGIVAVDHPLTPWLLAFSMFFFLSLACLKRTSECLAANEAGVIAIPGRAYRAADSSWLMTMGGASAFAAISTFFLFLVESGSPILLYPHPRWMWLICVIIGYWLCRTWALAARGEMHDDPVLFALRDRQSLTLAAVTALLVLMARH